MNILLFLCFINIYDEYIYISCSVDWESVILFSHLAIFFNTQNLLIYLFIYIFNMYIFNILRMSQLKKAFFTLTKI